MSQAANKYVVPRCKAWHVEGLVPSLQPHEILLVDASDYARLEQECERLKADRAACWAEFKVMTKLCLEAEKERDAALKQVERFQAALTSIAENSDDIGAKDCATEALCDNDKTIQPAPPVVIDRFSPPGNCRQRLMANGCAYPRSGCAACGKFSPRFKECDAALSAKP